MAEPSKDLPSWFKTPLGLSILIDVPTAFSLLARLSTRDSKTNAFRVLTTIDALKMLPLLARFLGGITCLAFVSGDPGWWPMAVGLVIGRMLGTLLAEDAPDFVEVGEAGIAVDHAMRRRLAVQRSW
jgi:hypothetical protein